MALNHFGEAARWYDALYAHRDYGEDVVTITACVSRFSRTPARTLLDVACGTGRHLRFLRAHYQVTGMDVDPAMLDLASAQCPGVALHQGDMRAFRLAQQFDVLTCLSRSTGAAETVEGLCQTLHNFAAHVVPGGLVIIEPLLIDEFQNLNQPTMLTAELPDGKVARLHLPHVERDRLVLHYHYLVATPAGVKHFDQRHELGVFRHADYVRACESAGLEIVDENHRLHDQRLIIMRHTG